MASGGTESTNTVAYTTLSEQTHISVHSKKAAHRSISFLINESYRSSKSMFRDIRKSFIPIYSQKLMAFKILTEAHFRLRVFRKKKKRVFRKEAKVVARQKYSLIV